MMKKNEVMLVGIVSAITISKDDETGEYIQGKLCVTVVRGARPTGAVEDFIDYDSPWVISADPVAVQEMDGLSEGDVILVSGTFVTVDVTKKAPCTDPDCTGVFKKKGTLVYVSPNRIMLLRSGMDEGSANEFIKEYAYLSNRVMLMGKLATDPNVYTAPNGNVMTSYALISRRTKELEEDPEQFNDFPMIRTYGKIAASNAKALRKGSFVDISGVIQTRMYEAKVKCPKCGLEFTKPFFNMEVIPYTVNYIKDFYTKEEIEKMEMEASGKSIESQFEQPEEDDIDLLGYETEENGQDEKEDTSGKIPETVARLVTETTETEKDIKNSFVDGFIEFDD